MKIAVGSDEKNHLTDFVIDELKKMNFDLVLYGPLEEDDIQWTDVAEKVATKVASGQCDQGILFCWTGTGCSIAANKVPGIRAALCKDAEIAVGARKWNDANILTMSLTSTSTEEAKKILEVWFTTSPEDEEKVNIEKITKIEDKYSKKN
ncbi:MAG: RpiB/LacA/LacB family sugar-phosphate isomerase [Thermodesulfobacteriota bacterium]